MNVQRIPSDQIWANAGWNARQHAGSHTTDDVRDLIADIQANGLLHPLSVRIGAPTPDHQPYSLVCGFRRFKALVHLGYETVPAVVLDCDEETAQRINLAENLTRRDLSPMESARALERAFPAATFSQRAAAEALGKHQEFIGHRRMLMRAPEMIQEMVEAGEIPLYKISEWVKPTPEMLEAIQQRRNKPQPVKPKPSGKRRRTKREISKRIANLIDAGHQGPATIAMAWCAGYVDDATLDSELAEAPCEA